MVEVSDAASSVAHGMGGRRIEWLVLAGLSLGASCSVQAPSLSLDDPRLSIALPAKDAACLIAEALAYAHPATQRLPLRPVAWAQSVSTGHWRVNYARQQHGSYLPTANGVFARELLPSDTPFSARLSMPFGRVTFRPVRAVAPRLGIRSWMTCDISATSSTTCTVIFTARCDDRWTKRRFDELAELLAMAEDLSAASSEALANRGDLALERLKRASRQRRAGLSRLHDPILAQIHGFAALLLQDRGELLRARTEIDRARLIRPHDPGLAWTQSSIRRGLAMSEAALRSAKEALAFDTAASEAQRARLEELRREVTESKRSGPTSLARESLHRAAPDRLEELLRQSFDRDSEDSEALEILASANAARSEHKAARRALMRRVLVAGPSLDALRGLARSELELQRPGLALRTLLRHRNNVEGLSATPELRVSAERLGWRETARRLASEGQIEATLRYALTWADAAKDGAELFVARLFASESIVRKAATTSRENVDAEGPPINFGSSGVRTVPAQPGK